MGNRINRKPAERFIKRGIQTASVMVRIDSKVKDDAVVAASGLNTSLNRFVEAALKWFLKQLKKEGNL